MTPLCICCPKLWSKQSISIMNFGYVWRKFKIRFSVSKKEAKKIFSFSLPFGLNMILFFISERAGFFLGRVIIPIKRLVHRPIRLYQSLLPFIAILSSVFFSEILIENDNKKVAKRVNQGLWLVNAICLPVIVGTYFCRI